VSRGASHESGWVRFIVSLWSKHILGKKKLQKKTNEEAERRRRGA
jgi:hypothetical protein